jgi:hypothetical protein
VSHLNLLTCIGICQLDEKWLHNKEMLETLPSKVTYACQILLEDLQNTCSKIQNHFLFSDSDTGNRTPSYRVTTMKGGNVSRYTISELLFYYLQADSLSLLLIRWNTLFTPLHAAQRFLAYKGRARFTISHDVLNDIANYKITRRVCQNNIIMPW